MILPDSTGDAIGTDEADSQGAAIAINGGTAQMIKYGVAYSVDGGNAHGGAQSAAVLHGGGQADAGDNSIAYAWSGGASVFAGAAYAIKGHAAAYCNGVAVVTLEGSAEIQARGGVACAMNFKIMGGRQVTDPTVASVSGGPASVLVAFTADRSGRRRPVVGLIGPRPDFLNQVPGLETKLLRWGVQFGLKAGVRYRIDPRRNKLIPSRSRARRR